MSFFTVQEKIVCFFIKIIELIINSNKLVGLLNYVSKHTISFAANKACIRFWKPSAFKGLSVAFIADGNRRWVTFNKTQLIKQFKDERALQEHKVRVGYKKIAEIVKFAYYFQLKEVSFYCFALKNFNRIKSQVDDIMNYIKKHGVLKQEVPVRFKIYGRMDMLDSEIREIFLKYEEESKHVDGLLCNIFFGYSSTDDETAMQPYINKVDLLVRTSGEKRISDFMVRNVATGTAVEFLRPLWPDLSMIHLYLILLKYCLEESFLKQ